MKKLLLLTVFFAALVAGTTAQDRPNPRPAAVVPKDGAAVENTSAPKPGSKKPPGKAEEKSEAFFHGEKIPHVEIKLLPVPGITNLVGQLQKEPRKYVKASLTIDGTVHPEVGIRLRGGAGSFRQITDKAGFTIDMNKFDGKEKFHGMDKWHVANSVQDGSYLSELLCGELFRAAGVPAARIHHATVSFNGQLRGFYYLKEGYSGLFIKRHFQNTDGNFYDGGFLRDIDQPLDIINTRTDVKDRADLKVLIAAAREPDLQKRYERLEKLLDMDQFISGFVVQTIIGDWDGYAFNRNNYRVYHDPKLDKISFIPSGLDQEFRNPVTGSVYPPTAPSPWAGKVQPQGLIAQAIFSTPQGKVKFLHRLEEINRTLMEPAIWLKRIDELQARVQPALAKVDAGAGKNYPHQLWRIRQFFTVRQQSIQRQLNAVWEEMGRS
jgi:hypothetical protein